MQLQARLVEMLSETFNVARAGSDSFLISGPAGARSASVRLIAAETALVDFTGDHRDDGLVALGPVGGDPTGTLAALALLSVHIEETMSASSSASELTLRVGKSGLKTDLMF